MKKFKILVALLFGLTLSGCNKESSKVDPQPEPEYHANYIGEGERMKIDYSNRKNECGVVLWWNKATIIQPNHFMVITPLSEYNSFNGKAINSGSLDFIYLENMYFNDGAFKEALNLGMVDYDYRQVYIYIDKPASVSNEEYPELLKNTFLNIRELAPEAEIIYVTYDDSETAFIKSLSDDVLTLQTHDAQNDIINNINSCTHEVSGHARPNDAYMVKRETIEWSKIHFVNATTKQNKNKRILHIGASVMNGSYPFIVENCPQYNIDYYCSSRGSNDIATKREIEFIFKQYNYDGIHFNSGSHIKKQSETECYNSVKELIELFKFAQPNAKIILSNSTPRGTTSDLAHFSDVESTEILTMSKAVMKLALEYDFPFDNLYNFAKQMKMVRIDAIHYNAAGYSILGEELANFFKQYFK